MYIYTIIIVVITINAAHTFTYKFRVSTPLSRLGGIRDQIRSDQMLMSAAAGPKGGVASTAGRPD